MATQWPLVIFTLCLCFAGGLLFMQSLMAILGKGSAKFQKLAAITNIAIIVIGGIAVFFHLQHWERIFNGFGHITSGITHELIMVVLALAILIVFLVMLKKGELPKWAAYAGLVIAALLVFVTANSYNMAARPVWNTFAWYLFIFADAYLMGALAAWLIAAVAGDDCKWLGFQSLIAGVVKAVAVAIYTAVIGGIKFASVGHYFDPTQPTKAVAETGSYISRMLSGDLAGMFWAGVILIGIVAVLVIAFMKKGAEAKDVTLWAGIACCCAVIGAICFRVIFFALGSSVFLFY
jgi:anaerobic dimethyl sulfoxide reductase subunit C (anchor subunit)